MTTLTPWAGTSLPTGLLIAGELLEKSSAGSADHYYAANGEITSQFPLGGPAEIDKAVAAAREALPGWRALPVNIRRDLLFRFGELIEQHAAELGILTTVDNSSTIVRSELMARGAAGYYKYYAGWVDKVAGEVVQDWGMPNFDYCLDEPYGVIGVIIPWNGPTQGMAMTTAPALAAGNTVVVKPPEFVPYSCLRMGQLALEAGIPPGVVNVVVGGPDAGQALCAHPGVDKIHFTGSGATARKILATAAAGLKPAALELGGKSATIVFDDADLAVAAATVVYAFDGAGQYCTNGTRVLVHSSVYDDFCGRVQAGVSGLKMGDPFDQSVSLGPVISATAAERITATIRRAEAEGATVLAGGNRGDGPHANGFFVEATVLGDVDNHSDLAWNEIFGPVIAVMPFDSEDEAVRIANDTWSGLAGYVYTRDLTRAHRMARALETGNVMVNGMNGLPPSQPFGGNKQSGIGRIGGRYGISEFTRPKNVWIAM